MKAKLLLGAVVLVAVGIVVVLKYQALTKKREQNQALRQQVEQSAQQDVEGQLDPVTDNANDPAGAEFKNETQKRYINLKVWGLDFRIYASRHNDRFPETWEQAFSVSQMHSSMDPAAFASFMNRFTNEFEIVYRGETEGSCDPGKTIFFREKQPRRSPEGDWVKVYGFVDGTAQIHTETNEMNFEAWEQQRIVEAR